MKYDEAVETWRNGNFSDFKAWVKRATKLELLNAIEYYSGNVGGRHVIITMMRRCLEGKE